MIIKNKTEVVCRMSDIKWY